MKLSLRALMLIVGLAACSPAPVQVRSPLAAVKSVEILKSKTVALFHLDEDGDINGNCTGTWVGVDNILTAAHCADNPLVFYMTEKDVYEPGDVYPLPLAHARVGFVTATDAVHDLALVWAQVPPKHGIATVSDSPILAGQRVRQIGHPLGQWWSYSSGDISALRWAEGATDHEMSLWIQATTPTSPGNSGGGLYNEQNELVGVASFVIPRGQLMNFFVHRDYIVKFLSENT